MSKKVVPICKRVVSLLCSIVLGGCMVGPNYKPPKNDVSDQWTGRSATKEVVASEKEPLIEWWKVFNDPLLNKYIEMGVNCNKNVLIAEANIREARAIRQVVASAMFPHLEANVNATKTYFSKNGPMFAPQKGATSGFPLTVQTPQIQNLYNALFDASWELDLFGKTRRKIQEAEAMIGSTIERKNDILLSVLAEIARNYMEVRSFQEKARLVKENIHILEQKKEIVVRQRTTGYVNQLDVESIEAELAKACAAYPEINALIYRGIYTLSVLTGNVPESLVEELFLSQPLPKVPESVLVGLRSDLLRRRPDIRQAERKLAAATANIGVAVASFFPSVSLSLDAGFQSLQFKKLFTMGSRTWDYGGGISLPIFEGGRLVGNLKASRAAESAAAYTYQQTVLKALEEAESALVAYTEALATAKEYFRNTEKIKALVALSSQRQSKGLVNMLHLLDTQERLNTAEQNLLQSDTMSLIDVVILYKALGGGWECAYTSELKTKSVTK